jgi:hypothetical protein
VKLPLADCRFVRTVIVDDVALDAIGFAVNEALVWPGSPPTWSCTLPVKPPLRVIVTM